MTDGRNLVVVEDVAALSVMEVHLLSPKRLQVVIGLSCLPNSQEPVFVPRQVRRVVGREPWIYVVKTGDLLCTRGGALGAALSLVVGHARIWRPGLSKDSVANEHPLIPRISGEPEAEALMDLANQLLLTDRDGRNLADQLAEQQSKRAGESPSLTRRDREP